MLKDNIIIFPGVRYSKLKETILDPDDDAPDLSSPEWSEKFKDAPISRRLTKEEQSVMHRALRKSAKKKEPNLDEAENSKHLEPKE